MSAQDVRQDMEILKNLRMSRKLHPDENSGFGFQVHRSRALNNESIGSLGVVSERANESLDDD